MTIPSLEQRRAAWSRPPVDDVGYISSRVLLELGDEELLELISDMETARYGGWRNHQNRWREVLGLDTTSGSRVLDYGCGVGIEALQYARKGNEVSVADISPSNVELALRVLELNGYSATGVVITGKGFSYEKESLDVVHCAGVLHHIPNPTRSVRWISQALAARGELRLMVYSDVAWRIACGTQPPERVEDDPLFERYWQRWDPLGGYADWYDAARLVSRFGEWFDLIDFKYLTREREYAGAILRKRS